MEEKKDWKDRLRDFPFIRMYLLKEFKANNPREQGMADILTLVKDKEFHDLIDFIQQELDRAREEGRKEVLKEVEYALAKDLRYELRFTEIQEVLSKLKQ